MELTTIEEKSATSDRQGMASLGATTPAEAVGDGKVAFRWELTRQEFVQAIADSHPEIDDPEGFFERHGGEIVHRFSKGFDALIGECGATYETIIKDVIDESADEHRHSMSIRLDTQRMQVPGGVRRGGRESVSQPSPSYSHSIRVVPSFGHQLRLFQQRRSGQDQLPDANPRNRHHGG